MVGISVWNVRRNDIGSDRRDDGKDDDDDDDDDDEEEEEEEGVNITFRFFFFL